MRTKVLYLIVVLALLFSTAGITLAAPSSESSASKVIFFAADGMRPDLMERYAGEGAMPTYADLMANGVKGDNGLVQAFPPNTGVGWYTLATGTYPSEHGSTNNTFFRTGDSTSITAPLPSLQASYRLIPSPKRPSGLARRSCRSSGPAGRGPLPR